MTCACAYFDADENFVAGSNGVQSYARPSAGPHIAVTHVPTEYGPTYVD